MNSLRCRCHIYHFYRVLRSFLLWLIFLILYYASDLMYKVYFFGVKSIFIWVFYHYFLYWYFIERFIINLLSTEVLLLCFINLWCHLTIVILVLLINLVDLLKVLFYYLVVTKNFVQKEDKNFYKQDFYFMDQSKLWCNLFVHDLTWEILFLK